MTSRVPVEVRDERRRKEMPKMVSANIDRTLRKKVYRRDGFRCALCDDTRGLQAHHVVLRSQGGADVEHNLITLCWKCHAVVHGTRLPEYPDYMTPTEMSQACVEYLADLYADEGILWNPWNATQYPLESALDDDQERQAELIGKRVCRYMESL